MVTFITVLQVNLVMSALLYITLLAYLCGFQVQSLDRRPPTHDPVNALIIRLLQEGVARDRPREVEHQDEDTVKGEPLAASRHAPEDQADEYPERRAFSAQHPLLDVAAELLKQQRRYNSPRVLLSDRPPLEPPPLYMADEFVGAEEGAAANRTRRKRHAQHKSFRGEYSVCDSESQWVTDKASAVDIRGRHVTILGAIKTGASEVKQYFYETKCRYAKHTKSSCRGIDSKHWNSQCKTTQTYVRALTAERSSVSWRWIRIDTSCVCALSHKRRRT